MDQLNYCQCADSHLMVPGGIETAKCVYCNKSPYGVWLDKIIFIREDKEDGKRTEESGRSARKTLDNYYKHYGGGGKAIEHLINQGGQLETMFAFWEYKA